MNYLSARHRPALLQQLSDRHFDLAIIGGGITGAGIALDAASRGMTVALVEMGDFASGTSSKSTKLIHGGLRYLKQLEIGLVSEVGRERAVVHRLAPHLVVAEKMLLPLVKGGAYGKWLTSLGLLTYDLLAGVAPQDQRQMLSREATLAEEPLLRSDILEGGGLYAEYRTDDARLTIEIIKTAVQHGALCANYVRVEEFLYDNSQLSGLICRDVISDLVFHVQADFVVNAAGPWVDDLRRRNHSLQGKRLFHSKGVHIVVPHERLPLKNAVYFDAPKGRMVFAIPRRRTTYLGTTDTPYTGDLQQVRADKADVDYILQAANQMFPTAQLTIADVESSWAGLRPLIFEEGKSASEMSRKDEIFESASGLISIAGGKLTGYRKMAEKVVNRVAKKWQARFNRSLSACHTDQIPLSGGIFDNATEVAAYREAVCQRLQNAGMTDPNYYAAYLVHNYGRQCDAILKGFNPDGHCAEGTLLQAELQFCLENELVFQPMDFFNRRTGRLYFHRRSILPATDVVIAHLQKYFGWNDTQAAEARRSVLTAVEEATRFE